MILSDREILAAIARGAISLTPCPPTGSPRWTSTALDLSLDAEIRPWEETTAFGVDNPINPTAARFDTASFIDRHTQPYDCSNGFVVASKQLVLGWTIERIKLPHRAKIAARVEGKSSLARLGLGIHVTAPTIHAGFGYNERRPQSRGSSIRLEIWNIGPHAIKLTKGMLICQLILEEVHGTPEQGYVGQFAIQGPGDSPTARASSRPRRP